MVFYQLNRTQLIRINVCKELCEAVRVWTAILIVRTLEYVRIRRQDVASVCEWRWKDERREVAVYRLSEKRWKFRGTRWVHSRVTGRCECVILYGKLGIIVRKIHRANRKPFGYNIVPRESAGAKRKCGSYFLSRNYCTPLQGNGDITRYFTNSSENNLFF